MTGYNTCLTASDGEYEGLMLSRTYYLSEAEGKNTYYINGTAWDNGQRVDVRFSCETSGNGHTLLSQASSLGRFAIEGAPQGLDVASQ